MRYKNKIFTALAVFSLFMASITFSISYSGNKVNELSNPFNFIPENSTFLLYSEVGSAKMFTFEAGNASGVIIDIPVNQFGGISVVFPKDVEENISLAYVISLLGYPIYKITVDQKILNQSNSSTQLYQKLYLSNTFYFSNPLPSIDILGTLIAVEYAIITHSSNQSGKAEMQNFIDTGSQFSLLYISQRDTAIKFISANLTSNVYAVSIMFSNSVNVNKIYIMLLGVLPHYILVYPPVGEKIELRISSNYGSALESIAKIIISGALG